MPQPIVRRIAHRAVQLAMVAAGIFVVMLVFSRQAHAATDPPPPPGPAHSSALSPVSTASSVIGSTVNAATAARASRMSRPGDPVATRAAILKVVDAEHPPLRIFFGDNTLAVARADLQRSGIAAPKPVLTQASTADPPTMARLEAEVDALREELQQRLGPMQRLNVH